MSNQPEALREKRVARVLVDTAVPHLDRLFDYEASGQPVQVGSLVRVKLAGRRINGFVLEVGEDSEFKGKLAPIERVVSAIPLVDKPMIGLAQDLAKRNATTVSKVLTAMVPSRHAGAEKAFLSTWNKEIAGVSQATGGEFSSSWNYYAGGPAFLERISRGESPRAVWLTLPGVFPVRKAQHPLLDLVEATARSGRRTLVVVPTARDVDAMEAVFTQTNWKVVCLRAADSQYKKYRSYLGIRAGEADVVIGTRSTVYAPVPNLGLISVWDAGDDRLADQQAPYLSALEIAMRRAHLQGCALLSAGASICVPEAQLIRSGWAAPLVADREVTRAKTAIIQVPDEFDMEREGPAGHSRIPPSVQSFIRTCLDVGPVLVHVPTSGYVSVIACSRCDQSARCGACHGPLRAFASGGLSCMWCNRPQVNWRCGKCGSQSWRSARVGSARTAEEFGRAFPGIIIEMSSADTPVTEFTKPSGIVIATPGMEPVTPGGYAAVVALDAWAILGRPELWAPAEAMRRWMNIHSLARPDGKMIVVGVRDQMVRGALVRRDPLGFAMHLLDERELLSFFPAVCMVAIDGDRRNVASFIEEVSVPRRCELVGVAAREGRDLQKTYGNDQSRAIYRCPWDAAGAFIESVKATQVARSMSRKGAVSVHVNPAGLL
ncbi:primosomal protein N' [uncultured Actinomyces sp.]|uniref:primosomal protein N' family DNA-binding protein n=1 Tax=uncultured Actinomyces sp. TaxID=249061 RepID=UPI002615E0B4|nr:primosomal protein N' [uncultured Actinomyces sp.]